MDARIGGNGVRSRYRPSGRFDPLAYAAMSIAVLATAGGLSWLLALGFEKRFYAPLLMPLGLGILLVATTTLLAVRLGHCRSPIAALLLGLVAALTLSPGHHLWPLVHEHGAESLTDLGVTFARLDARLGSAGVVWSAFPSLDEDEPPTPGDRIFLWIAAGLESVLLPFLCLVPAWFRVLREPYCEQHGRWMTRQRLTFTPGSEPALLDALDHGRLGVTAAAAVQEHQPNQAATLGLVDHCEALGGCTAGYLTLRPSKGSAASELAFEALNPFYRLALRCATLTVDEVEALRGLEPGRGTAAVMPSWASELFEESGPGTTRDRARVEEIEQPEPPPAGDRGHRGVAEAINAVVALGPMALLIALGLAAERLGISWTHPATVLVVVAALSMILLSVAMLLRDPSWLGDRYLLGRVAARIRRRAAPVVDPADAAATPIAIVPRSVWRDRRGQERIDHGWLAIRDDTIVFEGDRLRLWIPPASMVGLELERLVVDQYQTWYFAVLRVMASDGVHTLPLVPIATPIRSALLQGRRKRGRELFDRLVACLPEETWEPGAEGEVD